jgi:NitT/TauT family transport system substrate-binding protein
MRSNSRAATRAAFLGAGLAALAAPALGQPAPVTVRLANTADVDVSSVLWQLQNGIFERLGLRVEQQRLNSGSAVTAAVIGGSIDIGTSSVFGLMNAHLRGVPVLLESVQADYVSTAPIAAFVVAKDSPMTSPAQLNGQTVATPALGDLFTITISAWVDQNGGNSKSLNFVELPVPATTAAVVAGRIAGAFLVEPFLQDSLDRGQVRILGYPYNVIAPRFGVTYYFCMQSYAAGNADALARFRKALAEQCAYALAHKQEMFALAAKISGRSIETMQRMPFNVSSGVDLKILQPVIDFAARNKFIAKSFPASEMVDPNAL